MSRQPRIQSRSLPRAEPDGRAGGGGPRNAPSQRGALPAWKVAIADSVGSALLGLFMGGDGVRPALPCPDDALALVLGARAVRTSHRQHHAG